MLENRTLLSGVYYFGTHSGSGQFDPYGNFSAAGSGSVSGDLSGAFTVSFTGHGTPTSGTFSGTVSGAINGTISGAFGPGGYVLYNLQEGDGGGTGAFSINMSAGTFTYTATIESFAPECDLTDADPPLLQLTGGATLEENDGEILSGFVTRINDVHQGCRSVEFTLLVSGTATYGEDYVFTSADGVTFSGQDGSGVIQTDESVAGFSVVPIEDSLSEESETIIVTLVPSSESTIDPGFDAIDEEGALYHLDAGSEYTIDPGYETITWVIEDNDEPTVTIQATEPLTGETGTTPGQFTVTRDTLGTADLTVNYSVGGTATASDDYTPLTGSVVIPAGEYTALVDVAPVYDGVSEDDETVDVTLTPGTGYMVGPQDETTVTITDQIVVAIDVDAVSLFPATGVAITWTDTPYETSYRVLRAEEDSSVWTEIGTTGQDVLTFTDDTAEDKTYRYRIEGINSVGLAGEGESQPVFALSPGGDEDNDGLSNLDEYNLGTDIYYFDTDDDLLSDAWEVEYGFDPFNPDQNANGTPDADDDFDGDGLSNLQESNYGVNPFAADSDGDGTSDGDEIQQGSLPNDPSDNGAPPADGTIAQFRVSIGDPSSSHSERWKIVFTDLGYRAGDYGFEYAAPDFGEVGTDDFWFQTGESYQVRVEHLGSNLDYPDYDWLSWIEPTPDEVEISYDIVDDNSPPLLRPTVHLFNGLTNPVYGEVAYLHVEEPFNVIVDSNNDGNIDSNDDVSEDTYGTNSHPGKVILVNDGDIDRDGFPDYVDGFDDLAQFTEDDTCGGCTLTPIQITAHAIEAQNATVIFDYDASDPQGITASLTEPFILSPGKLRIWRVDGNIPRDPRPVDQGGDFIAPGVSYNADALGFTDSSTRTFYVEAIREDTQISGSDIRVEIDRDGTDETIWEDTVRLHSVRFELLAREPNDSEFYPVLSTVVSNATLSHGFTVGADVIDKIRVYDARTDLSTITLEDTSINLQPTGLAYETPEFQLAESFGDVPGMAVLLSGVEFNWSYNPSGSNGINKLDELSEWDNQLVEAVKQAAANLEGDDWTPANPNDAGAFGKEIHRLTREALEGQDGWLTEVFVENGTNKILSFGDPPVGVPSANYTQVDFIRTKDLGVIFSDYYAPTVGDVIDPTKIDDVYDVKTSINGSMTQNQKQRLKSVLNGWGAPLTRDIKVAKTPRRYTVNLGWEDNPKYRNGLRILGLIGLGASAYSLLNFSGQEEALQVVVDQAKLIQQVNDPDVRKADLLTWLQGPVKTYLSYMIPDDTVLNIGVGAASYQVLLGIE